VLQLLTSSSSLTPITANNEKTTPHRNRQKKMLVCGDFISNVFQENGAAIHFFAQVDSTEATLWVNWLAKKNLSFNEI
jgi:hypothetical protein